MANYVAKFRTSYFPVKDEQAFRDWVSEWVSEDLNIWTKEESGSKYFSLGGYDAIPSMKCGHGLNSEDTWDELDGDFSAELTDHLPENWAATITEIGHEKLRYLSGFTAVAYADGKVEWRYLSDIGMRLAEDAGFRVTDASY